MAQSSIHIDAVTTGSFLHNDRTMKPSYLIDDSSKNDCTISSSEALQKFHELKAQAEKNYTARTGQKVQKKTVFLKEAIVNLEAHHTLKDLEPIIEKLKGYGFTILQTSIHRDEGFVSGNRSGKNYHAHITLFNLDPSTGKTVKFGKDYRHELSKLQTLTAQALKMERGTVSVMEEAHAINRPLEKAKKRLDTHEYKRAMKLKDDLEAEVLDLRRALAAAVVILDKSATPKQAEAVIEKMRTMADQKQLEEMAQRWEKVESVEYNFRETQKQISALEALDAEQKKELHRLNGEINKIKADDELKLSKIRELENRLAQMTKKTLEAQETLEAYKDTNSKEIEALKASNEQIEKLYGQIEGLIEEGATSEDLKAVIKTHEQYKPKSSTYLTAKERAQNAYRSKLGKPPLQPKPKTLQDAVQQLKDDKYISDLFKKKTQNQDNPTQTTRPRQG